MRGDIETGRTSYKLGDVQKDNLTKPPDQNKYLLFIKPSTLDLTVQFPDTAAEPRQISLKEKDKVILGYAVLLTQAKLDRQLIPWIHGKELAGHAAETYTVNQVRTTFNNLAEAGLIEARRMSGYRLNASPYAILQILSAEPREEETPDTLNAIGFEKYVADVDPNITLFSPYQLPIIDHLLATAPQQPSNERMVVKQVFPLTEFDYKSVSATLDLLIERGIIRKKGKLVFTYEGFQREQLEQLRALQQTPFTLRVEVAKRETPETTPSVRALQEREISPPKLSLTHLPSDLVEINELIRQALRRSKLERIKNQRERLSTRLANLANEGVLYRRTRKQQSEYDVQLVQIRMALSRNLEAINNKLGHPYDEELADRADEFVNLVAFRQAQLEVLRQGARQGLIPEVRLSGYEDDYANLLILPVDYPSLEKAIQEAPQSREYGILGSSDIALLAAAIVIREDKITQFCNENSIEIPADDFFPSLEQVEMKFGSNLPVPRAKKRLQTMREQAITKIVFLVGRLHFDQVHAQMVKIDQQAGNMLQFIREIQNAFTRRDDGSSLAQFLLQEQEITYYQDGTGFVLSAPPDYN